MRTHADKAARTWKRYKAARFIMITAAVVAIFAILLKAFAVAVAAVMVFWVMPGVKKFYASWTRKHFLRADAQRGIDNRVTGNFSRRESEDIARVMRQASGD
jgi:hypothetical protein